MSGVVQTWAGTRPSTITLVVWRASTFERVIRRTRLLPVATATGNRTGPVRRVRIPLFHLPAALDLESLCLSAPTAAPGVIVLSVLVTYLSTTFATSELSTFAVAEVEVAPDDALVKFCTTDVPQTR